MKKWKMACGIVGSLLAVGCLGVCGWWLGVKYGAPNKYVSSTYEVGMQKVINEDGEEDNRYFCEVRYHKNSNNSGYEMFEVKFNYMLDETQTAFYSQGLQYVAEKGKSLDFKYYRDATIEVYNQIEKKQCKEHC